MIKHKNFIIACLLILLPLIDSLLIPVAFGIQWQDPKTMYLVSAYFIPFKLVLVTIGGFMLASHGHSHHQEPRKWYSKFVDVTIFILAGVQFIMLGIVCALYLVVGTQADNYRRQGNITVYTSDVGALGGEANHHFSYQCTTQNGFYKLTPIVTLDWLGHFTFTEKANTLIIKYKDYTGKGEQVKKISLKGFECEF
ncbi:MAG: hypothetical protein ACTH7Q_07790 [Pseudoalteromonas sp.]|uniref:hypothetical protein n=2 Tax=Pseudoalteromonas TaxID=53246 RepID=UPI003F951F5D